MKTNFVNPNYNPVINGKTYHVNNSIASWSTDKNLLELQYYGYKYGNQVVKVGEYATKTFNEVRWNLKEMFDFIKNPTFPYTTKGMTKKGEDSAATLNITETAFGYTIEVVAQKAVSFFIKKDQWDYFISRIVLGVQQYFYSQKHLSKLNSFQTKMLQETYPELLKYFDYEEKYKAYGKEKEIFTNTAKTLAYDMSGYGIKKAKFNFGKISSYIDIQYALLIAQDIKSEKYFKMFGKTTKPLFTREGGTNANKAGREDKQPEARVFSIVSGSNANEIIFRLEVGKGETTPTNGIVMKEVEKKIESVLTKEEALEMSKVIEDSILSFLIYEYVQDSKREDKEQKLQQPIKVEAKKSLVEVKSDGFCMEKIRFNFAERDEKTLKQTKFVDYYMTEQQLYDLTRQLFDASLIKKVIAEKKRVEELSAKTGKREWAKAVLVLSSGTSSKRSGGQTIAKTFNIAPPISKTADFNITGVRGKGSEDSKGLIKMVKPEYSVPVPVTADNMKMLMLTTNIYWRAFKIAQNIYLEELQAKELKK